MNKNYTIEFLGAAKEVTGSCFLVTARVTGGEVIRFLVDCGMYQINGNNYQKKINLNASRLNFANPEKIDFILLTHAHVDHSGLIPYAYSQGFSGPIFATSETIDLCKILLLDSGHIAEDEAERQNIKNLRLNRPLVQPLYTVDTASASLELFSPIPYSKIVEVCQGIKVRFKDAKHIPGSAVIEIWITDSDENEIYGIFSGDVGESFKARYSQTPDFIVLESTYGNREREMFDAKERDLKLARIILDTYKNGGRCIIPGFAVGRTQSVIHSINQASRYLSEEEVEVLLNIPFVIDTPMGINVTGQFQRIFENEPKHLECLLGSDVKYYTENNLNPFSLPNLIFSVTPEESKALNESDEPLVVVSASGMCNAGRIRHHLKHNIWKENTTIIFVGFQAQGTPGRRILDGCESIKLFDEEIAVNAQIEYLPEFSAHASQNGLLKYVNRFKEIPNTIFLVHGEESQMNVLKEKIEELGAAFVVCPELGDDYLIQKNQQAQLIKKNVVVPPVENEKAVEVAPRKPDVFETISMLIDNLSKITNNKNLINELSNDKFYLLLGMIKRLDATTDKARRILRYKQTKKGKKKKSRR